MAQLALTTSQKVLMNYFTIINKKYVAVLRSIRRISCRFAHSTIREMSFISYTFVNLILLLLLRPTFSNNWQNDASQISKQYQRDIDRAITNHLSAIQIILQFWFLIYLNHLIPVSIRAKPLSHHRTLMLKDFAL